MGCASDSLILSFSILQALRTLQISSRNQEPQSPLPFPISCLSFSSFDTIFVLHYNIVMKNVTITLSEEVARWARVRAAKENTSVSRLVGEMLHKKMLDEETYLLSMEQYLSQRPMKLKKAGAGYPLRSELHER